ncbi:MAG: DUF3108 domain-containing protein [Pseudomonadota bacterium]
MRLIALTFLSLIVVSGKAPAADLYLKYKLYALGLPIGSGTLSARLNEETYSLKSSGQTAAFGRLVSDGKGTVEVRGGLNKGSLVPETYSLKLNSEDETGTVSMQMNAGKVAKVAVNPPQDRMNERIKVTAGHLNSVLDPLSAALMPASKGLMPESCNRTLQLYDGKERYNVHLSYKEKRRAKTADGRFNDDVLVCRARYEPIAGHRPKRKTIQELAQNKSIEVWLAPIGDAPYLVPLRASIKAPFGSLVLQAEKYKLSN